MSNLKPDHPLHGATLKVIRAQVHVAAAKLKVKPFTDGERAVGIERECDPDSGNSVVRFVSDDPGADLSVVIGDCLFCLRSALDHIVYALVRHPTKPTNQNQFPICSEPDKFAGEVQRGRLKGLSNIAQTTIEELQPYGAPHHSLALLRDLHNVDKHRTLNLTVAIPGTIDIAWREGDQAALSYRLEGEGLTRGTKLLHEAIAHGLPGGDVQVSAKASSTVVFLDKPCKGLPVVPALEGMVDYFNGTVLAKFKPFFC